jgi:hypothetical protein
MKRLLFCVVALIAVMALVAPTYAAEMKINGINRVKFISADNLDGNDDTDDNKNFVKQRLRMYFTSIASENLKVVYKNEIDFEWGDDSYTNARGQGGALGGDTVNLETKNIYMEFMIPDTPVKTTIGLQGVTLHKGWFISDDIAAARFDLNFDPVTVMAYWGIASDKDYTDSNDDIWQVVASGAYKAENMDARLSIGYEKGQEKNTRAGVRSDDFYLAMGELNMSFDMVSFFVIAATNFGERDGDNSAAGKALDRDYSGYMFHGGVSVALDMATIRAQAFYASGDSEDKNNPTIRDDDNFRSMSGQTFSWAEIVSDGYFWEANSNMTQISSIGAGDYTAPGQSESNHPSNVYAIDVGVDFKPTDTTSISLDIWYIGMVEDRSVGCDPTVDKCDEDTIGVEVDAKLVQKVYDNLDLLIVGAYMLADDGYGTSTADRKGKISSGDDAYVIGLGLNYKF